MNLGILAAAAAAFSIPIAQGDTIEGLTPRATSSKLVIFDDLPSNGYPVPVPYNGLNFSYLYPQSGDGSNGQEVLIIPKSEPNFAIASGCTNPCSSAPYINIAGTKTKSFDLDSFYVGCFDGREEIVDSCNFSITGYNAVGSGHQGPLLFTYNPTGPNFEGYMSKISVGWKGLRGFYTNIIADDAHLIRYVKVIDNVKYTIHT